MAQPITITVPHRLGKAEARARIAAGFERLSGQIAGAHLAQFQQAWAGDRLHLEMQQTPPDLSDARFAGG